VIEFNIMKSVDPNKNSILRLEKVSKVYGQDKNAFVALEDVSLEIMAGESLAIIGKSGSGKSTLVHLMALLDKPSEGHIFINNQDSSKLSNKKTDLLRNKNFGFVFQQFFLNPKDSVLNNVILPLRIAGVSRSERNKRGIAALEDVDLLEKAHEKANNLSGGQKQRLCIARALINQPKIIFADEPTGNLDSINGQMVEDLLFRLNKEKKITLIIVTHDEDFAKKCQQQVKIQDGKIL